MTKPYKLTEEIKQFIIKQKKENPKLSCRAFIPLIREHFQVSLSKSLINNVIKQNNLIVFQQPLEIHKVKKISGFLENGGCLFLKAADFKLSLTRRVSESLLAYFPNLSKDSVQGLIEALIFMPLFKNKKDLWLFMGREISLDYLDKYSQQLAQVPVSELNKAINKSGFNCNFNDINELYKKCLQQLNSYVQVNFFPSAYQFLDFLAMQERFYALWAKVERKEQLLDIQFFYPQGFSWRNDLVWQEDLLLAVKKANELRVFTQEKELIRINPQLEILPPNPI